MEDKTSQLTVSIKRAGNILSVTPHMYSLLGPVLTYKHRTLSYGVGAAKRGSGMSVRSRQLYRIDGDSLYTTQGALKRITDTLTSAHIPYTFEDLRKKQVLEPDYEHLALCMPGLKFRLKQDEVLAHLIAENSGIIVAPTAYGKTFIMLAVAALYPHANIIMASPSSSLLRGAYRRMLAITADVGRIGGGYKESARVTLCTFASLMNAPVKECDILLLDECMAGSSIIITEKGAVPISRVRELDCRSVLTSDGLRDMFKPIDGFYAKGRRKTVTIKTTRGTITCTPEHKIKTRQGWLRADELQQGQEVASTGSSGMLQHARLRLYALAAAASRLVAGLPLPKPCVGIEALEAGTVNISKGITPVPKTGVSS